ncbi:E3 ubiquitin-protein ligase MARCH3-like isoform X2 [Dinothrombium tinctorium]|uniref:E3 ubiquitin-protein ligase MARCH3-like isoform X2 n=1 Tax=Dinothrombium tinctorium TaxID=1965070 RepID=A0A3S3SCI3_9ACAR|nr:E3 ubiquitin-protein ligase MARCH3-like isoform X2 [Dinothrombium tinctorium]
MSSNNVNNRNLEQCRICLQEEDKNNLIDCCECRGSLRYAHKMCLKIWIENNKRAKCDICSFDYKGFKIEYEYRSIIEWLEEDLISGFLLIIIAVLLSYVAFFVRLMLVLCETSNEIAYLKSAIKDLSIQVFSFNNNTDLEERVASEMERNFRSQFFNKWNLTLFNAAFFLNNFLVIYIFARVVYERYKYWQHLHLRVNVIETVDR